MVFIEIVTLLIYTSILSIGSIVQITNCICKDIFPPLVPIYFISLWELIDAHVCVCLYRC